MHIIYIYMDVDDTDNGDCNDDDEFIVCCKRESAFCLLISDLEAEEGAGAAGVLGREM